jgi:cyclohexanone monooxygenase
MPTEKYAHGPEILSHSQAIGRQYELYNNALFHTQVKTLEWDDTRKVWRIQTDRGDDFTAKYVAMGTGPLHVPKLPGISGIESFKGHSFHTSRWDYDYTGGDPLGAPLDKLGDKRVAIIGTGATAVQCVPHLARACKALYVCQRTPSSVDVRDNVPIDPDWFKEIATPGWQERWLENFAINQTGGLAAEDWVQDGWTDLSRRVRERIMTLPPEQMTPENMLAAFEETDHEKMEEIRQRVETIVADKDAAQKLKAWYRQLCKRPCFHDEYLQSFNEPGTKLVDTDGKGVERITPNGVVVGGKEYEVDCIIYASGFEVGTPHERRSGFDMVGRDGLKLSDYWAEGMRSRHGIHVHGFPNAFLVQMTQGANLLSNFPHNLSESARTVAAVVKHAQDTDAAEVEVPREVEDEWLELLRQGNGMILGSSECTPGYYNNEGQDRGLEAELAVGHPEGAVAYFNYIRQWRESGEFEGLQFR